MQNSYYITSLEQFHIDIETIRVRFTTELSEAGLTGSSLYKLDSHTKIFTPNPRLPFLVKKKVIDCYIFRMYGIPDLVQ